MRIGSWMVLAAVCALLIVTIGALAADVPGGKWVRQQDEEVWVRWTLASNIDAKERLEAGFIRFGTGFETIWGLDVYNNRSEPIRNVTLIAQVEGVDFNITLYETHAGDEPQHLYAFWGEIPSEGEGFVQEGFKVPDETGPWTIRYVVFFETAGGENHYSVTTYNGEVVEADTGPFDRVFQPAWAEDDAATDEPGSGSNPIGPGVGLWGVGLAAVSAALATRGRRPR